MTCPNTTTAATAFNFAALNRTVWTARKQSLSGNAGGGRQNEPADPGTCDLCGAIEDTAHILTDCNNYSYKLWERFGKHLTAACRTVQPDCGMILLTFSNIMYFIQITGLPPPPLHKAHYGPSYRTEKGYIREKDRKMFSQRPGWGTCGKSQKGQIIYGSTT
jgi:hypothetical protein